MRFLGACFGSTNKFAQSSESGVFQSASHPVYETRFPTKTIEARRTQTDPGAEQWDWDGLVALLTGDVANGDWWDIMEGATAALTKRLPVDHASVYLIAGAGVAALAVSGTPLFGVRVGQLLLPGSFHASYASTSSDDDIHPTPPCAATTTGGDCGQEAAASVDLTSLAAALQDQSVPVPVLLHTAAVAGRRHTSPGPCADDRKGVDGGKAAAGRPPDSGRGACGGGSEGGGSVVPPIALSKDSCPGSSKSESGAGRKQAAAAAAGGRAAGVGAGSAANRRHFVAVGIPGGKALAGILLLSVKGPSPPAAWHSPSGLRTLAALLAPLLRPPQVPLARRALAELLAAATISDLVRHLHAASSDLMALAVRVCLTPRVALLRNDGTAAAVFAVSDGANGGGTSVCHRRSRDVLLVDAGGSGFHPASKPQDFFMTVQPVSEKDSLGGPAANGPAGGLGGIKGFLQEPSLPRLPGGGGGGAGGTASVTSYGVSSAMGCRGQSLPLQHTLLSEALSRGSGLCISDCNAYVQDSKAYPRDLMLFKGATPPQSLALATSCHCGRPLLALYATYHSVLPQGLLQAVVQELGQLLRAVTPSVAALLLPGGAMADEWSYLHDHLLAPNAPHCSSRQQRCSNGNNGAANGANQPNGPSHQPNGTTGPCSTAAANAAAVTTASCVGLAEVPVTPKATTSPRPSSPPAAAIVHRGSPNTGRPFGTTAVAVAGGSPAAAAAAAAAAGGATTGGIMSHVGALFRRAGVAAGARLSGTGSVGTCTTPVANSPQCRAAGSAAGTAASAAQHDLDLVAAMNVAAEALAAGGDATAAAAAGDGDGDGGNTGQRLAAFISGGASATPPTNVVSSLSGLNRGRAATLTGRTSFSLEAAGSPRGGVRLAPLITTLHDRLKSAQAEQLTASSRAASRLQDLESLRFLERVGKGGYGSVYRGLYHGAEVAIKVVEDPASSLTHLSNSLKQAAGQGGGPTTLRAKHLHDAIELVASVSMSHPNIVQLITYFVDVRAHQGALRTAAVAAPAGGRGGGGGGTLDGDAGDDDATMDDGLDGEDMYDAPPVQLVHMPSSGLDSTASSFTEMGGNEAIVLVMEYCDRGSLKDAILEGSFLHKEARSRVLMMTPAQQQQLAKCAATLLNMKAIYSTLLEVALALRHMHGLHMVHCDLKPQNVLLKSSPRDPRGFTAKLSDFGLAKMMAHDDDGQLVINDSIQSGTITHLPPEALQGRRQLGPAVDVYAFGIVMFQLLCGMTVYRNMDVKQMIRGVVRHALRPSFPAWVPAEYRDLAQRCWHEAPACRPTSLQLVAELESLLEACDGQSSGQYGRRGGSASAAGSIRSAAAAAAAAAGGSAAAAAPAARRRLPQRCATETAIHGRSPTAAAAAAAAQPANGVGGVAAAAAAPPPAAAASTVATMCAADINGGGPSIAAVAAAAAAAAAAAVGGGSAAASKAPSYFLYSPPNQLYQPAASPVASTGGAGGGTEGRLPTRQGSTTGAAPPVAGTLAAAGGTGAAGFRIVPTTATQPASFGTSGGGGGGGGGSMASATTTIGGGGGSAAGSLATPSPCQLQHHAVQVLTAAGSPLPAPLVLPLPLSHPQQQQQQQRQHRTLYTRATAAAAGTTSPGGGSTSPSAAATAAGAAAPPPPLVAAAPPPATSPAAASSPRHPAAAAAAAAKPSPIPETRLAAP